MRLSKRYIGIGIVVVIVGGLGAGVYFRLAGSKSGTTDPGATDSKPKGDLPAVSADSAFSTDMPIPVEGAPVIRDTMVISVTAEGEAAAWRQVDIKSQVAGRVLSVDAYNNKPVRAGDPLLTIDTTDYALQLENAQAQLRGAELKYQDLTIGDDRMITDSTVRQEREQTARARSGLDQARIAVQQAELTLARARITAPFGARVANLAAVAGQTVSQGETLLSLVDLDPIKVEVQVLEGEVGYLKVGGQANVTFSALPDTTFKGRIQTINPSVDKVTRMALVTVLVPNPGGRILPGFYARASLAARKFPNRIMVPSSAILDRDHRTMLFVFDGDGTTGHAKWQYVATGLTNGAYTEIVDNPDEPGTEMLEPGQIVLTAGHYTLTHGAAVRLTTNVAAEGGRPR